MGQKQILKTVLPTRKFEIEDFFVFKTINGAISDFRSKMVNITSTAIISKVFHRNADFWKLCKKSHFLSIWCKFGLTLAKLDIPGFDAAQSGPPMTNRGALRVRLGRCCHTCDPQGLHSTHPPPDMCFWWTLAWTFCSWRADCIDPQTTWWERSRGRTQHLGGNINKYSITR